MTDPHKTKQLNEAWKLIRSASHKERAELFRESIQAFEERKSRFDEPENRFDPYSRNAEGAMYQLESFYRILTGYSVGWVSEYFLEHRSGKAGRPTKYNTDTRSENCFFITQMVHRGASETQAMKLLVRMRGDRAMSSGHLRELQNTYRDYKKIEYLREMDLGLVDNSHKIAELLELSISDLESDEIASRKAVEALRSLFQELIDLMKSSHDAIASGDGSYPEIYGCLIDWIKSEYEDPLDYFYSHESHRTVPSATRKRALREYINTIPLFTDHDLP